MGITFTPREPEPTPTPPKAKRGGGVTFTPVPESNPLDPSYDTKTYGPRTPQEETRFRQEQGLEPLPEPEPEPIPEPIDAHEYLLKYADPTEAERLRRTTDFQYDPSRHGVTTESFQARKKATETFHGEVRLTHQSLDPVEEITFRKQFVKDGKIIDQQGALDYLLLYGDPSNIERLQSSITGLKETPLVLGESTRTKLEKEQQEAISGAWESLTDPEKVVFAEKFPESIKKSIQQLAFESEREVIRERIIGGGAKGVGEMARFVSGVFIKPDTLLKSMGQIFFGGKQKGERILDIIAGQSMAFKGKGVPELFVESYKLGGFGFTTTLAAATFGIGKAALPVLAAKGAGGVILAEGVPLAIGGGFSAAAGAQIGYTGAMEKAGLTYKGATAEQAFTYGGHFALFVGTGAVLGSGTAAKARQLKVRSKTDVIIDPKNPLKSIFRSTRIDVKNMFSLGRTHIHGQDIKVIGKTYHKTLPGKWKYTPFKNIARGKPVGDQGDIIISKSVGASMPYKKTLFGGFKAIPKKLIVSMGLSQQKTIFAGESHMVKGDLSHYLQQTKHDVSLVLSRGIFHGKHVSGTYKDIARIVKPQIKGSGDYYGETAKFDLRTLSKTISDSLIMPGGSGIGKINLQTFGALPTASVFGVVSTQPVTLSQLEALESGIVSSAYWSDVKTKTSKALGLTPISTLAQVKVSKTSLSSKTALGQVQMQTPLSIQSQTLTQSQMQLQSQLQKQSQLQAQSLTQAQAQLQVQLQSQMQLQSQVQLQAQLQIMPTIEIIIPFVYPLKLPSGKHEPVVTGKPGQAYKVQYKERYIYAGKKRKPERYKTLRTKPLSKHDADKMGSYIVDESTARSYRLKAVEGTPQKLKHQISSRQHKFYPGKKGENIEKTIYAIDSPGELKGITAKGILANMNREHRRTTAPKHKVSTKTPSFLMEKQSKSFDLKQFKKMFRVSI